jgi:hypothetical protein
MGGKNKKKKSKTSGNGAAAAIAGAVSEAPDAAAEEEGPRALPPVWQPPPKVSQEMQVTRVGFGSGVMLDAGSLTRACTGVHRSNL